MADETPAARLFDWYVQNARKLRESDRAPAGEAEAARRGAELRRRMREAEGAGYVADAEKCPLDAQVLGALQRDGYRIERLTFQSRNGVYVPANVFVPAGNAGRRAAVLCVHGHWAGARRDPVVQSRCIGLAKLGFVVLVLDAWGAGERGTVPGQNEYHGGLLGASLWPVGTPLHGMQLHDNVRAIDYLISRPDVDRERIGCTGASGGGNQTTYTSAFDARIQCAVPVCSVGTFESYFGAASCVDEVLRGGLTFAEEGDLLGSVAPRALMVVTATRDTYHFGPKASALALERARGYFKACGAEEKLRHALFESGHDYSRPMREAMYGWMRRWLQNEGNGSPVPEPEIRTEPLEAVRCFDPAERPAKIVTTVQWVRSRAGELAAKHKLPATPAEWRRQRKARLEVLRQALGLDRTPAAPRGRQALDLSAGVFRPEPGVELPVGQRRASRAGERPELTRETIVVLLDPSGKDSALRSRVAEALLRAGAHVCALELRGCGSLTMPDQGLGANIPDHNLVEWSLWLARPLLGQWVEDARRLVRSLAGGNQRVVIAGWREAGLAALLAAALERGIRGAAAIETLATFVSNEAAHQGRMVLFSPDLMYAGDIPQLAALAAPKPVLLANPLKMSGGPATREELPELHRWSRELYQRLGHADRFHSSAGMLDAEIAAAVLRT